MKFSAIVSWNILSALFSLSSPNGTLTINKLVPMMVSFTFLDSVHFFLHYIVFLFHRFNSFYFSFLKFVNFFPSACFNLPLNPSSKIFILLIIHFSSRISFFLTFLSLNWYFHLVHTLLSWLSPHLSLVLWTFLRWYFKVLV